MAWDESCKGLWSGVDWAELREGEASLDPYLLWAELDQFANLSATGFPAKLPVLIQVAQGRLDDWGVELSALLKAPKPVIVVSRAYLQPAEGIIDATYWTASVSAAFFACLRGRLKGIVERVELGTPVVERAQPDARQAQDEGTSTSTEGDDAVGRGNASVVLAAIDDGIAFAHQRFRGPGGHSTRVGFFWNQDRHLPCADSASGFGYGEETLGSKVSRFLKANSGVDDDQVYRHFHYTGVARRVTHGTHVLDLASGDDAGKGPPLICVQLPREVVRDTSTLGLGVHVLDGVRYILDRAHRLTKPGGSVVVNLSYASMAGPHDGSSMIESALAELIALRQEEAPLSIVLPAGNHRQARGHAQFRLMGGEQRELRWKILPDDRTPSFLEIWCPDSALTGAKKSRFEIEVTTPSGATSGRVRCRQVRSLRAGGALLCSVICLDRVSRGKGTLILVAVSPTVAASGDGPLAPFGTWTVRLKNIVRKPADVNAWIQRDDSVNGFPRRGRQSYFDDPAYQRFDAMGRRSQEDQPESYVKRAGTLSGLATGEHTVVMAGYRASDGALTDYSGRATAAEDRLDAAAVSDDSPVRRGILAAGSRSGSRVSLDGTSVATPQAARLLVEEIPAKDRGTKARAAIRKASGRPSVAPSPSQVGGGHAPKSLENEKSGRLLPPKQPVGR